MYCPGTTTIPMNLLCKPVRLDDVKSSIFEWDLRYSFVSAKIRLHFYDQNYKQDGADDADACAIRSLTLSVHFRLPTKMRLSLVWTRNVLPMNDMIKAIVCSVVIFSVDILRLGREGSRLWS
jgi:hypothetical protein